MLNMSNEELAKLLTNLFNTERQNTIEWEKEVQCGYDYDLFISADGEGAEWREAFKEEEILALLNSRYGYICGQYSVEGFCHCRDIYKVGNNHITHEKHNETTATFIEEYLKRKAEETK